MKAKEDFVIAINKDRVRVPFRAGIKYKDIEFIKVKKGKDIPQEFLKDIVHHNLNLVEVEYKWHRPILPPELELNPPVSKKMKIKKREYSRESLTKILNDKGFGALRIIGQKFDVKDRSSRRLINEILTAQEAKQRRGL